MDHPSTVTQILLCGDPSCLNEACLLQPHYDMYVYHHVSILPGACSLSADTYLRVIANFHCTGSGSIGMEPFDIWMINTCLI